MPAGKRLVVSAVNFTEGGPLTILRESLDAASTYLSDEWHITALVHSASLIDDSRIEIIEYPRTKSSWVNRVRAEWSDFYRLSKSLNADLWLSLHDITPRVRSRRQVVYCHNPSPFYCVSVREALLDPKFAAFTFFYSYLYRAFIKRNYLIVVQQEWLRKSFKSRYSIENVVVSSPLSDFEPPPSNGLRSQVRKPSGDRPLILLYPALPRVFKNFDVVCEAIRRLPQCLQENIELRLTIDGTENAYAKSVLKSYRGTTGIKFLGKQSPDQMRFQYMECDAVVFPSKLETWGLPISEAKRFSKPLLVADLPYAHETVGGYNLASFLAPDDALAWKEAFKSLLAGVWEFEAHSAPTPLKPYAENWDQLWKILTEGL